MQQNNFNLGNLPFFDSGSRDATRWYAINIQALKDFLKNDIDISELGETNKETHIDEMSMPHSQDDRIKNLKKDI